MFGDWKRHGVDIEQTRLGHEDHLSRLTFAVALHYLWLVTAGSQATKSGHRAPVDRRDRRDLSMLRIGLYTMERYCALATLFVICLVPYFEIVG